MRKIFRKRVLFIVFQLLLSAAGSAWATSHRYDYGIVSSITDNEIILAGKVYKILPATKVILKVKDAKGAYYEHKGRLSSLKEGEKVSLKVIGYDILEVEVVR